MPQCKAFGCFNKQGEGVSKNKSFFTFPKDRHTCQLWLDGLKNAKRLPKKVEEYKWMPSHRVCEDHFSEECFYGLYSTPVAASLNFKGKKLLKAGAVPAVHVDPESADSNGCAKPKGKQCSTTSSAKGKQCSTISSAKGKQCSTTSSAKGKQRSTTSSAKGKQRSTTSSAKGKQCSTTSSAKGKQRSTTGSATATRERRHRVRQRKQLVTEVTSVPSATVAAAREPEISLTQPVPRKRRKLSQASPVFRSIRCPLEFDYSTSAETTMECAESIKQTAMDRPHSCQHCSATFVLASSLRTHAAHIHGDGLPSLTVAESGCHPSGDPPNHGDTTCDIEPDNIKMEVCEEDSIKNNTLVSDNQTRSNNVHGDNVTDSRSGIFDDTTCDIKPDKIKMEFCEEDSAHNTLMPDNQKHASDVHNKNVTDNDKSDRYSGVLDATAGDTTPDKIKTEECEMDRVQSNILVTDQVNVSDERGRNVTGSCSGTLDDTADDIKPDMIKLEVCDMDSVETSIVMADSQTHVSDVHGKNVTGKYSGTLDDASGDVKPGKIKIEICDMDSEQSSCFVSDSQTHVSDDEHDSQTHGSDDKHDSQTHGSDVKHDSQTHGSDVKHDSQTHGSDDEHDSQTHGCDDKHDSQTHGSDDEHDSQTHVSDDKHDSQTHGSDDKHDSQTHGSDDKHDSQVNPSGLLALGDTSGDMKPCMILVCQVGTVQSSVFVTDQQVSAASSLQNDEVTNSNDTEQKQEILAREALNIRREHSYHLCAERELYACGVCKRTFKKASFLRNHELAHTRARRAFTSLKSRARSHTRRKPHACKECKKTFKTISSLKKHKCSHI